MRKQVDILIVGAGVGGLVLALVLGRKGFRVALLEHHPGVPNPKRGEILQPNGLKVLDQIGVLKDIEARRPHRNHLFHFSNIQKERLLTVDYQMLPPPYPYCLISLPEMIHEGLVKALDKEPSVRLSFGVSFKEMERQKECWIVRGLEGERVKEWETKIVVGCDGVFSRVRECAGMPYRIYRYPDAYFTTVVGRISGFDQEGRYYIGKRKILGIFPVSSDQTYLFYLIPVKDKKRFESKGIQHFQNALCSIDERLREPLQEVTSFSQIGFMPCTKTWVDSWVTDGVALIGDAAHAMNPHVAQGRNQAMEDAITLGEILEGCFKKGDFSKKALLDFERSRKKQVECLQNLGDELNFVWNSGFTPMVWLRERIFREIGKNMQLQYVILGTVAGVHSKNFTFTDRMRAVGIW